MADRSLSALLAFLDYLAAKGLMARNTVAGRKAAASRVLGILDPEEQTDISQVDLDAAMARFINLEGKGYTPSSLAVYKSRVASAINDFVSWSENPAGYKPSVGSKKPNTENGKKPNASKPRKQDPAQPHSQSKIEAPVAVTANVFPIPIRSDVVVRIHGLPFDLTAAEAEKIAAVVKAMAIGT